VPDGSVASVVYTSDDAYQDECTLNLYSARNCRGEPDFALNIENGVSACTNAKPRYARLVCELVRIRLELLRDNFEDPALMLSSRSRRRLP
jgi:hypothetical protein